MRDRYRGLLRWKRRATKASDGTEVKKKKKKKTKVIGKSEAELVEDNKGNVSSSLWEGDGWWEEQVGAEQTTGHYASRKRLHAYAHWAMRASVTHLRQERAAAKLQRRWEWHGGMPQPRLRVGEEERTGSSSAGDDDDGRVWWWEERKGEEKAVQFYVTRCQRIALRHYALTSAGLYIRDMVMRFHRMQVQKKALRYWRQGTTGGQSATTGVADGNVIVQDVVSQIVMVLFEDNQVLEWAKGQAAVRGTGTLEVMQELALVVSREVLCRARAMADTVTTMKRMMETDALI